MKTFLLSLITRQSKECMRVAEVLQRHLDGAIDDATAAEIQAHLDACRDCGLEADAYFRLKVALAERGRVTDDEAVDRLRAFVDRLAAAD